MAFRSAIQRLPSPQRPRLCHIPRNNNHARRRHASGLSTASDLSTLQTEMTSRQIDRITDHVTPVPSRLLQSTLTDFLPLGWYPSRSPTRLNPGYHLIHFPSPTRLSTLLPDGTDPIQSPGDPFNKRMWAGGSMTFSNMKLQLQGRACFCYEQITDVQSKGQGPDQKVFVQITRSVVARVSPPDTERTKEIQETKPFVVESRTLVFMRDDRETVSAAAPQSPSKILRPTHAPDISHTLVPTAALLFRFSALTFNAHAIHLDKLYCQEIEGHRNLLVHGPLSLVLLLDFLRCHTRRLDKTRNDGRSERISYVEYRNMVPLYAEEEMKVCVRLREDRADGRTWDVWIEGRDGGYAVKGLVKSIIEDQSAMAFQDENALTQEAQNNLNQIKEPRPVKSGSQQAPNTSASLKSGQVKRKELDDRPVIFKLSDTIKVMHFSRKSEQESKKASAARDRPASTQKGASVNVIPIGDEIVTDEAAFQRKAATVPDMPTENEAVPDDGNTSRTEGASDAERPANKEPEGDNAPYYQR